VKALISDIHSNFEALTAVLEDIARHDVTEIYCLGDIIGYGPNPRECIDRVRDCKLVLLGNHDQGAMFDPDGFNAPAERAIFWTRSQLEAPADSRQQKEKRWEFLAERPRSFRENGYLFVHGSARNPLNEYVFPEDIYNQRKMERIFALVDRYCFQGHTHIPGVFTEDLNFLAPEEIDFKHTLGDQKVLVNVGSVGQPRNSDNRASYIVLSDSDSPGTAPAGGAPQNPTSPKGRTTITFRRVPYDFERTIAKIYEIPDLDNFLGDRLRDGR
jgi:predicted phosphodiesterase